MIAILEMSIAALAFVVGLQALYFLCQSFVGFSATSRTRPALLRNAAARSVC